MMCPNDVGRVTVRLKTTAETFAGTPATPAAWNDTEENEPTGAELRVSRSRAGAQWGQEQR